MEGNPVRRQETSDEGKLGREVRRVEMGSKEDKNKREARPRQRW